MWYKIEYKEQFLKEVEAHRKAGQYSIVLKIEALKNELREHPTTGTGLPHPLSGDLKGQWARHITHKHRMIYEIHDSVVTVTLVSAHGHYGDK